VGGDVYLIKGRGQQTLHIHLMQCRSSKWEAKRARGMFYLFEMKRMSVVVMQKECVCAEFGPFFGLFTLQTVLWLQLKLNKGVKMGTLRF
jgi:hypothetical protein